MNAQIPQTTDAPRINISMLRLVYGLMFFVPRADAFQQGTVANGVFFPPLLVTLGAHLRLERGT